MHYSLGFHKCVTRIVTMVEGETAVRSKSKFTHQSFLSGDSVQHVSTLCDHTSYTSPSFGVDKHLEESLRDSSRSIVEGLLQILQVNRLASQHSTVMVKFISAKPHSELVISSRLTHAQWSYHTWFRSLLLCPLSEECYYSPLLILHKHSRPHPVSDYNMRSTFRTTVKGEIGDTAIELWSRNQKAI